MENLKAFKLSSPIKFTEIELQSSVTESVNVLAQINTQVYESTWIEKSIDLLSFIRL